MSKLEQEMSDISKNFGDSVRNRRKELGMTQEDVALASGVSRRFVIELESGRPTCELGRSLLVAAAVGLHPIEPTISDDQLAPLIPEILDEDTG